jgi:hypothetical protein
MSNHNLKTRLYLAAFWVLTLGMTKRAEPKPTDKRFRHNHTPAFREAVSQRARAQLRFGQTIEALRRQSDIQLTEVIAELAAIRRLLEGAPDEAKGRELIDKVG